MNINFDAISNADPSKAFRLAKVIEGDHIGEAVLLQECKVVSTTMSKSFLDLCIEDIKKTEDNGIFEAAGTKFFMEILGAEKKLVICGAGHVSIPVIKIAKMIGMHVTVIDDRSEFCENAKAAGADTVITGGYEEILNSMESDIYTFYVIVTRGHACDAECLNAVIRKPNAYIGMIGSKKKIAATRAKIEAMGADPSELDKVHMPIGLSISAETPEEIAVSIIGEIIQIKNEIAATVGFEKNVVKVMENDTDKAIVLATIVAKQGSGPRDAGAKMVVGPDGLLAGTIGGGKGEAIIIDLAKAMLADKAEKAAFHVVDMTPGAEEGMICGGVAEVLLEPIYK